MAYISEIGRSSFGTQAKGKITFHTRPGTFIGFVKQVLINGDAFWKFITLLILFI